MGNISTLSDWNISGENATSFRKTYAATVLCKSNASDFRRISRLFAAFRCYFIWNDISLIFRCNFATSIVSIRTIFRRITRSSRKFVMNLRTVIRSSRKCVGNFRPIIRSSQKFVAKFLKHSLFLWLATSQERFEWLCEYSLCKATILTAEVCFINWMNCSTKLTCVLSN